MTGHGKKDWRKFPKRKAGRKPFHCVLCRSDIRPGDFYYDAGNNVRAHVPCGDVWSPRSD